MASITDRAARFGPALTSAATDVHVLRDRIVNVAFIGYRWALDREWVVVDAGLPGSADRIRRVAEERFGSARPAAIILTHGHFDHVGGLAELAEYWDCPVYAHPLELPYITGRSSYPPPDPTVGGGAMAWSAKLYPRGPVDIGERARVLPEDGAVPFLEGWRWLHTAGHSPGHVSLWRASDKLLIAGDAFVTTRQESLTAVLLQWETMHGPPAYYTQDWALARGSVERLAALEPEIAVTGHGPTTRGEPLREALWRLARDFDELARPRDGRYVREAARADASGTISVPPPRTMLTPANVAAVGVAAAALATAYALRRRREGFSEG